MAIFLKDPAAVIDYAVDWAAAYLAGQTIISSGWTVAPDGASEAAPDSDLVLVASGLDGGRTTATLSGGQRGHVYRLTNNVTFSDGRRDERSLDVRVEDR